MKIFHDSWGLRFKEPFGALPQNKSCRISILVEDLDNNTKVNLVIYKDGKWNEDEARRITMVKSSNNLFSCEVTFKEIGYYFYFFEICVNDSKMCIVRDEHSNKSVISDNIYHKWQITIYDEKLDLLRTGFENGVMYQIFPDSFYFEEVNYNNVPNDRIIVDTDYNIRVSDENRKDIKNNTYYGGNLKGIIKKLDYLKHLGVSIIYLNPIFEAHSNHRYNTADFMNIDPLLGTNEDFCDLCKEAHKRGIRIILDGVFNHVGSDSVYFNKYKRYSKDLGAYNSKESKYYSFFEKNFVDYPDLYKGWWGDPVGLPEVDTTSIDYQNYICGDGGVLNTWLSRGADGFRLDVIDELPNEFINILCRAIKKFGGKIIIGEVWEDATDKFDENHNRREYLLGRQIDSVMNYPFLNSSIEYIRDGKYVEFYNNLMTILDHYPRYSILNLMNSLSTHDRERVRNRLASEGKREFSKEQLEISKKQLKILFGLQYTFPGIPCTYYGDEKGMFGVGNLENRSYMNWEKTEDDIEDLLIQLANFRKECNISSKEFKIVSIDESLLVYNLSDENEKFLVVINRTNKKFSFDEIQCLKNNKHLEIILSINNSTNTTLNSYEFIILKV